MFLDPKISLILDRKSFKTLITITVHRNLHSPQDPANNLLNKLGKLLVSNMTSLSQNQYLSVKSRQTDLKATCGYQYSTIKVSCSSDLFPIIHSPRFLIPEAVYIIGMSPESVYIIA